MFTPWLRLITHINVHLLIPVVIAIALTGVYVLKGQPADMILTLVFGMIGYLMIRFDYPRMTLVIALVLGEIIERSLHQTLMISDDDLTVFFTRLPSIILLVGIALVLALPALRRFLASRRKAREVAAE